MCIKLICNLYNDISTSLLSMFGGSIVLVSFDVESLHQTWKISSSTLNYALDNSVLVYNNRKIFVLGQEYRITIIKFCALKIHDTV